MVGSGIICLIRSFISETWFYFQLLSFIDMGPKPRKLVSSQQKECRFLNSYPSKTRCRGPRGRPRKTTSPSTPGAVRARNYRDRKKDKLNRMSLLYSKFLNERDRLLSTISSLTRQISLLKQLNESCVYCKQDGFLTPLGLSRIVLPFSSGK
jgi:hypothetical protein